PAFLASLFVMKSQQAGREHVEKLLIILRSASSPAAAEIVREAFRGDVLEPLARLLGGADAEQRAALSLAVLIGTTILHTIMAMEPLCTADDAALRGRLTRLFEAALAPA
ncbi:MAG: TetR/AcrR family transcriptional regulator, partial [Sphingosinicella sp.]|uniref:TetR/AcrR family transcriptional regulator n=1 Tax=Sphingosinicella sp. TaxID=1917971 RepID=UPI004037C1D0